MNTAQMTNAEELLVSVSGPILGMMFAGASKLWREASVCAMVQSAYNFLPLYPCDGGRVIKCLVLKLFGSVKGERIWRILDRIISVGVIGFGVWLLIEKETISGAALIGIVFFQMLNSVKSTCKERRQRVQ